MILVVSILVGSGIWYLKAQNYKERVRLEGTILNLQEKISLLESKLKYEEDKNKISYAENIRDFDFYDYFYKFKKDFLINIKGFKPEIEYGDYNQDSKEEALVIIKSAMAPIDEYWIYGISEGFPISYLHRDKVDSVNGYNSVKYENGYIIDTVGVYFESDPPCCPKYFKHTYFKWDNTSNNFIKDHDNLEEIKYP